MQEIVQLAISIHKLQNGMAELTDSNSGITFCRFLFFFMEEDVVTDKLLVSDEGVRCLNEPLR